jgi:hypothetical protein
MRLATTLSSLALLVTVGCKQEQPTPETTAPETPQAETPAAVAPAAGEMDIPTPEDFEEEATEDITVENMEQELDRLEAEIGG